ncbi:MAG TPA: trypsin-like peptidase domain-containing protein [Gemmatimonadales bacterium]|jgi:serine protease Do|nr:trypsin-like peptidase domain-containing protein [Gemmatimonadales bacterium]
MLDDEVAGLAEWLRRVTVVVRSGRHSAGAGVVWRRDGLIVTNAHVAASGPVEVRLADSRVFPGRVVRRDESRDLAVIATNARGLAAAEPADGARPGQLVVAVGHPLGLAHAVALGVVHAVPAAGPSPLDRLLRMDLRLAPGNSGGPVADTAGRVLGVSTLIVNGLAHAIPSAAIARFLGEADTHRAA